MERFNLQDQEFIITVYRRYKSNPKAFIMTEEERLKAMRMVDLKAFDLNRHCHVMYYGYMTSVCLLGSSLDRNNRGEDNRTMKEVLSMVVHQQSIKILHSIRNGELTDAMLADAMYIQMGIAHNIIPNLWEQYERKRVGSEVYRIVLEAEEHDGIVRN